MAATDNTPYTNLLYKCGHTCTVKKYCNPNKENLRNEFAKNNLCPKCHAVKTCPSNYEVITIPYALTKQVPEIDKFYKIPDSYNQENKTISILCPKEASALIRQFLTICKGSTPDEQEQLSFF